MLSDWLEPAWRSDRMCWMLLFNALGLAFELGVFDGMDRTSSYGSGVDHTELNKPSYHKRVVCVRRLLYIYVTQTSGRLGWTSPLPSYINDPSFFKSPSFIDITRQEILRRGSHGSGDTNWPDPSFRSFSYDMTIEKMQVSWMDITILMKRGNELLFPSRDQTREIIRSGRYLGLLETFQPLLRDWRSEFDKLNSRLEDKIAHCRQVLTDLK